MNILATRIIPMIISISMLFSCATVEEEAVQPTQQQNNDTSVLEALTNLSWRLNDCPTGSALNIDGFTECDYLNYISFTDESVFIRHGNNPYFTKHNICSVDGGSITLSRQGCGFTNWSGVVHIEVVSQDESELKIDVSFPNLISNYNEMYIYEKA